MRQSRGLNRLNRKIDGPIAIYKFVKTAWNDPISMPLDIAIYLAQSENDTSARLVGIERYPWRLEVNTVWRVADRAGIW